MFRLSAKGRYDSEVSLESLRRVLPYTALVIVLAAIYSGMTIYSRYRDALDAEQRAKDREAALNKKTVDFFGGDRLTILTFAAEPAVVAPGGQVLLCYGVNNAVAVKIEPDAPAIKPAITHCLEVHPKKTTLYTLTAEDAKGNRKEQSLTIRVQQPKPESDSPAP
jgi:hypothetical protein